LDSFQKIKYSQIFNILIHFFSIWNTFISKFLKIL
jgi:hypothetical protein